MQVGVPIINGGYGAKMGSLLDDGKGLFVYTPGKPHKPYVAPPLPSNFDTNELKKIKLYDRKPVFEKHVLTEEEQKAYDEKMEHYNNSVDNSDYSNCNIKRPSNLDKYGHNGMRGKEFEASVGCLSEKYVFAPRYNFLLEAANQYSKIGEDEVYRYRAIHDEEFIESVLDFFGDGKAITKEERTKMEDEMVGIVKELAATLRNGGSLESLDFKATKSTLTIGGEQITLGQLIDIQEKTKAMLEISDLKNGVGNGEIVDFSKLGLAKATLIAYANETMPKGLADAYSKAISHTINIAYDRDQRLMIQSGMTNEILQCEMDSKLGAESFRLFSGLDTSSKENLAADFSNKMNEFNKILDRYNNKLFGLATIDDYRKNVVNYFSKMMNSIK